MAWYGGISSDKISLQKHVHQINSLAKHAITWIELYAFECVTEDDTPFSDTAESANEFQVLGSTSAYLS